MKYLPFGQKREGNQQSQPTQQPKVSETPPGLQVITLQSPNPSPTLRFLPKTEYWNTTKWRTLYAAAASPLTTCCSLCQHYLKFRPDIL